MRLGLTGNLDHVSSTNVERFYQFLKSRKFSEIHHISGTHFDKITELNIPIIIHHPDSLDTRDLLRNNQKVAIHSDILIAFSSISMGILEPFKSGVYSTIRLARKKKRPILIFYPDDDYRMTLDFPL